MSSVLSFLLAQTLPFVAATATPFDGSNLARAHILTSTDYAIMAALVLPACALAGSIVRDHRRHRLKPDELQARKRRLENFVWVNTRSGIYYFEGERWYKRTREGMLISLYVAKARGYRGPLRPQLR